MLSSGWGFAVLATLFVIGCSEQNVDKTRADGGDTTEDGAVDGGLPIDSGVAVDGGRAADAGGAVDGAVISDPDAGTNIGDRCDDPSSCTSGYCVDGVCCDSACGNGQANDCQACSVSEGSSMDGVCAVLSADHICRPAAGACDVDETCTGIQADCPSDNFRDATHVCRAAAGVCDVDETCTGIQADCPGDTFRDATHVCRAAAGVCDVDETCTGTRADCPDDNFRDAAHVCRAAAGVCDVDETCTGIQADCPGDNFRDAAHVCRAAAGVCDVDETCTGVQANCPDDNFRDAAHVCRAAAGVCDVDETCSGIRADCPDDNFRDATHVCRAAAGVCDVDETCTGIQADCPDDNFRDATHVCRAAADTCDVAETCTGALASCPPDATRPRDVALTGVLFVDVNTSAQNPDGQTWANAFPTVQQALDTAADDSEIWVAKGRYVADTPGGPVAEAPFFTNVKLFGGFVGCEQSVAERPAPGPTTSAVLDGDRDGNGGPSAGDSQHVVHSDGSLLRLDGFVITNGNATDTGGGLFVEPFFGFDPLHIAHVIFTDNHANVGGGALATNGVTVRLSNVVFRGNTADVDGGAIWSRWSLDLAHAEFHDNRAGRDGGAIWNGDWLSVANASFQNNHAERNGGAILSQNTAIFANITVAGNIAGDTGGGIAAAGAGLMSNTVLWNNTAGGTRGSDIEIAPSAPGPWLVQHSCSEQPLTELHATNRTLDASPFAAGTDPFLDQSTGNVCVDIGHNTVINDFAIPWCRMTTDASGTPDSGAIDAGYHAQTEVGEPGMCPSMTPHRQKIGAGRGRFSGTIDERDEFGDSVTPIGDVDQDGVPDVAVGTKASKVWILFLTSDGGVKSQHAIGAGMGGFTGNIAASDRFGEVIARAGDLDGNGVTELAVGAPDGNGGKGTIWVLFLDDTGMVTGHREINTATQPMLATLTPQIKLGSTLGIASDLDNDGTSELLAGNNDATTSQAKPVWLLSLDETANITQATALPPPADPMGPTGFGAAMHALGDLDGNGISELAVGTTRSRVFRPDTPPGAVWILFLDQDFKAIRQHRIGGTEDAFPLPLQANLGFARALTSWRTPDTPDRITLAVSDPLDVAGALWVFTLDLNGVVQSTRKLTAFDNRLPVDFIANERQQKQGSALAALGDLDGDGLPELVWSESFDDTVGEFGGAVWVLFSNGLFP